MKAIFEKLSARFQEALNPTHREAGVIVGRVI
jgi:hypothetical protein